MENRRMEKINRLIQKDLSEILREKSREEFFSCMITVTRVDVTSDLSLARVYVSIFELKYRKEDILAVLKEKKDLIRMLLAQRVRHQLRIIPDIAFFLDDTLDYAKRIDELLKK
ncbi:MAG: 30S ribosome-binding factor RbfA [Bacteroidales bacterium]|nr:30S ribosome-binding factor RbfA [Bacteroidales bacterium]